MLKKTVIILLCSTILYYTQAFSNTDINRYALEKSSSSIEDSKKCIINNLSNLEFFKDKKIEINAGSKRIHLISVYYKGDFPNEEDMRLYSQLVYDTSKRCGSEAERTRFKRISN
jgi:hypothetical protein